MLKKLKALAILGVILSISGIAMLIVAQERYGVDVTSMDGSFNFRYGNSFYNGDEYVTMETTMAEVVAETVLASPTGSITTSGLSDKFDSIELDFNVGNFNIYSSDEFYINAGSIDMNCFKYVEDGNTLKISYNPDLSGFLAYDTAAVAIYIPDRQYKSVKIDADGGYCFISYLHTDEFELDADASQITFGELFVSKSAKFDLDVVDGFISNSEIKDAEINISVGDFQIYESNLTGNSKISIDVGKVNLDLNGVRDDYLITSKSTGGSVNIYGDIIDPDKDPVHSIDVETNLGSCDINFLSY